MSQVDSGKFCNGRTKRKPNPTSERYRATAASGECRSTSRVIVVSDETNTRAVRGTRGLASDMAIRAVSRHGDWNCFPAWRPLALRAVRHKPIVGEHAGRNSTAYSSRCTCVDHGAYREASFRRIRPAATVCVRQVVLAGYDLGTGSAHYSDTRAAKRVCILLRRARLAWSACAEICRILGRFLSAGRRVRRIPNARLHPVHSHRGLRFLARRHYAFHSVWSNSPGQSRRSVDWRSGRRTYRFLLLPDPSQTVQS